MTSRAVFCAERRQRGCDRVSLFRRSNSTVSCSAKSSGHRNLSARLLRRLVLAVSVVLAAVFYLTATTASAQENDRKLLNLLVRMQGASVRSHSPILLDCTLEYAKSQLLEGSMRLRIREMDHFVMDVWVNDLVLPGGESVDSLLGQMSTQQLNSLVAIP